MKKLFIITASLLTIKTFCQEKNFIDKSYIETNGIADTLVIPNRIYIDVLISEKDTKGKQSVEDLEKRMLETLKSIGIDIENNVSMQDMVSNYKKYFLKQTDIQKAKSYSILVFDAKTTSKIFIGLEEVGISNVSINKLEHSDQKKIQLIMNNKAIENAKANAISFSKPLNQKIGNALYIGKINSNFTNQLSGNVAGITIRGTSSLYGNRASNYDTTIEFEKIKIISEVGVKFSLE